ncbi:MAG: hypothetical protein ACE5LB_07720 [Acidiferrobacterales bacterium]
MRVTDPVVRFVGQLGILRLALASAAVFSLFLAPLPGTPAVYVGWDFVPTVLAPVLAPLIFLVLLLDTMMSGIFMLDKQSTERRRFQMIMVANLVLAAIVVIRWLPYYLAL